MPHTYFESDGLTSLKKVYDRALAILAMRQPIPVELRDTIAARIFSIASDQSGVARLGAGGLTRHVATKGGPSRPSISHPHPRLFGSRFERFLRLRDIRHPGHRILGHG
jgi:hypothetical protein